MEYRSNISKRKQLLKKLLSTILFYEKDIINALYLDFKKPELESVLTEINIVQNDLKDAISNINSWSKPQKVWPSLLNFPSKDYIIKEPFGKVLIMSPWNYPFQLALCPMIAAIAAGNQVVLKPSELSENTSLILKKIIDEVFEKQHVEVVLGDKIVAQNLLEKRWDFIFFTGSVAVGKIVAQYAAKHLTPTILELGGKNPCIVDQNNDIKLVAKRIVWGKFMNTGQTCIAPDYVIVHQAVKSDLIACLKTEIVNAFSENPFQSPDYARIINKSHWQRLHHMLNEKVIFGGVSDEKSLYIAPTLIDEPHFDDLVMQDEIFGPILPILTYENESQIEAIISKYEKPLALYVFSTNKNFYNTIISKYSFGGGCINDTVIQFTNKRLPFGGVGHSGHGAYHGKLSFDNFCHQKSIIYKYNWLDLPFRYAPYGNKINYLKKLVKFI
ncbi:aldehyde dehydrogenase family protein [Flavobacterium branchiophilum]|uniref:Aldehyde dehydrogenase n=1 Tax=Flavobacterium branchiophilum TaxID=55197 RepID=A0A2H3KUV4_9FLAO|nr:aldehyde dehydrogenase family protein [Flavobacterium branchiophilum]PDS26847.1 aldehyde dehydrogenase [Flavobacterium branchiophilum]